MAAPVSAAQVAIEAAGWTTALVPTTSITWQFRAAATASANASEGSISPNQTTPGRIIDPQAGQWGMSSNPSSGVARISGQGG